MSKAKALLASLFLVVAGLSSSSLSANCGWGGCDNYCPECDSYGYGYGREYRGDFYRAPRDGYGYRVDRFNERPYWREYSRDSYRLRNDRDSFYRDERRDGYRRDMLREGLRDRRDSFYRDERRDGSMMDRRDGSMMDARRDGSMNSDRDAARRADSKRLDTREDLRKQN